jgi:post-segregation antitoxin (ccd killing protein)
MGRLHLRLPNALHNRLRELARQEGVSMNQLIATAVAEKVSALMTADYLVERAARADQSAFERVLGRVPDVEPDAEDRLGEAEE